MLGGVCGLVGTSLLGPRSGIFDKTNVNKLVKAANQRKRIMGMNKNMMFNNMNGDALNQRGNYSASMTNNSMSSIMTEQTKTLGTDSRVKDFKNFYKFDEETPMKFRIYLFR